MPSNGSGRVACVRIHSAAIVSSLRMWSGGPQGFSPRSSSTPMPPRVAGWKARSAAWKNQDSPADARGKGAGRKGEKESKLYAVEPSMNVPKFALRPSLDKNLHAALWEGPPPP